ncbi:MAG: ribosome silencing factor [Pararhodobacter sp.]
MHRLYYKPMHPEEVSSLSYIDPAALAAPASEPPSYAPASAGAQRPAYSSDDVLALVLQSLDDDKAEEIAQVDLRGRSSVADHMVICSGRSSRQVAAISEKLIERVKGAFHFTPRSEGKETGDWVLIDTGDVVVHIFRPEVREFYQLERMWQVGPASV